MRSRSAGRGLVVEQTNIMHCILFSRGRMRYAKELPRQSQDYCSPPLSYPLSIESIHASNNDIFNLIEGRKEQ
jgi:hypothetical protein